MTSDVHEWGAPCDRCGGVGFRTEEERASMPGCPMNLDYELPLGTEAQKIMKAREVSARRNAGNDIQQARKAAGLTQAQLASKAGVTRSVVAMGETSGSWSEEALSKIKHSLAIERNGAQGEASHDTTSGLATAWAAAQKGQSSRDSIYRFITANPKR